MVTAFAFRPARQVCLASRIDQDAVLVLRVLRVLGRAAAVSGRDTERALAWRAERREYHS